MKLLGVKVIDFSMFLPGPHLTMMMADHGATVLRIEPPPEGEPVRHIGLSLGEHSIWFRNTHRGKRSAMVNLKDPLMRPDLLKLIGEADVLVEAYRPGVMARLGLDYESMSRLNPRLVYVSISAFGQSGPLSSKPAHDLAIEALSGALSVNLGQDDLPTNPAMPCADMAASLMALSGIMMALYRRHQSGQGDYLDLSMQDALMAWMPNVMGPVFAEQRAPVAKHERSWGGNAFYRIYRTQDGRFLALGGSEHKFVHNLLAHLGRIDLAELTASGPGPHQLPLVEFLSEAFASQSLQAWQEELRELDVCWAPVLDLYEAWQQPQIQARAMLLQDESGLPHIGVPIKFRLEPAIPSLRIPALGEHGLRFED